MKGEHPESFLNRDEALIAAEAEKPVRDLAREDGVDEATKKVFDKRAEERGEEALDSHRRKKESLTGLVNPELAEVREKLAEVNSQLEKEFGVFLRNRIVTPRLASAHHDENGKLDRIAINELLAKTEEGFVGIGPLGEKLKEDSVAHAGQWREGDNDQYILDAYKYDKEVRVLIDRFIELNRARSKAEEGQGKIIGDKKRFYMQAANINEFLGKIGREPNFPADLEFHSMYELLRSGDQSAIDAVVGKVRWAVAAFNGLVLTEKEAADFGLDLDIIGEELDVVIQNVRHADKYPKEKREKFVEILQTIEVGKRLLEGLIEGKHYLYTVKD